MNVYVYDLSTCYICTCCGVPVNIPNRSTHNAAIRYHEETDIHKNSGRRPSTPDEITAIVQNFNVFVTTCVVAIKNCLPCKESANACFLSYVGTRELYDYCSNCKVLTVNKENHNNRMCLSKGCITTKMDGVKNKFWTKRNPKIIIVDRFNLFDKTSTQYMCHSFQQLWSEVNKTIVVSEVDEKTMNLLAMIDNQAHIFASEQKKQTAHCINNKLTPNKYVGLLHWDTALDQCMLQVVESMTLPDRFGNYEGEIGGVLERMDSALWYALELGQGIVGHPVLRILGTKDSGVHDQPLNLHIETRTWKKYYGHIKKLCLILFRLKDTSNSFHALKLPEVDFTNAQTKCMDECLSYPTNNDFNGIECHEMHLAFLLSLIDQSVGDFTFRCPLMGALAIFSIKSGTYMPANILSPMLGGILTVYRMLLLYDCIKKRKDAKGDSDYFQKCAMDYAARFLHVNDKSYFANPLRELIRALCIVSSQSRDTVAEATLFWSDSNNVVTHRQVSLRMDDLHNAVICGIENIKILLMEMLEVSILPLVPLDKLYDDIDDTRSGYNFMKDDRNEIVLNTKHHTNLLVSKKSAKWMDGSASNGISEVHKSAFESKIHSLLSILLPLIHVTYGLPGRGTETTNLLLANVPECGRNIMIHRGCVAINTIYHKGMQQTGKTKDISRYLPNEVGELLVLYMWRILPFWQPVLASCVQAAMPSPFLFGKDLVLKNMSNVKLWDTVKFSKCLETFFGIDGLTIRPYRHIAIAIGRVKLNLKITTENDEADEIDYRIDMQASHSSRTARQVYALVLNEEEESYYSISKKWHAFIMRHHSDSSDGNYNKKNNQKKVDNFDCITRDVATDTGCLTSIDEWNHMTVNSGTSWNDINEVNTPFDNDNDNDNDDNQCADNDIFSDLSTIFDFDNNALNSKPPATIISPIPLPSSASPQTLQDNLRELCRDRRERLSAKTTHQLEMALRHIVKNDSASFHGNQLQTLRSILSYKFECIVQICPTGGGKSMAFMLSAYLAYGGTSIVIVPYRSVQKAHYDAATNIGIQCVLWKANTTNTHGSVVPKLIFITPEALHGHVFRNYLVQLVHDHQLDRIFFDECQSILESFRPLIKAMVAIIQSTGVQLVCLTATLPFVPGQDESALLDLLGFHRENAVVYRTKTTRTNIKYVVENVNGDVEMYNCVQYYLSQYGDKVSIIYVPTIDFGKSLQLYLSKQYSSMVPFYNSQESNKDCILEDWFACTGSKFIIATTALGCGIDIPNIQLVIYAGLPFSLVDFVQGSGRAGRDGNPSYGIVLRHTKFNLNAKQMINGVQEFIASDTCRRCVLDKFMDGDISRVHCSRGGDEILCDYCEARGDNFPSQSQMVCVTPIDDDTALLPCFTNSAPLQGMQYPHFPKSTPQPKAMSIRNPYTSKVQVVAKNLPPAYVTLSSSAFTTRSPVLDTLSVSATASGPNMISSSILREEENRQRSRQQKNTTVLWNSKLESLILFFANPEPNKCLLCKILRMQHCQPDHHRLLRAVETQRKSINNIVAPSNKSRNTDQIMPDHIVCFRRGCFVPQTLCQSYLAPREERCKYSDILLDVVLNLLSIYPDERKVVYQMVGGSNFMYRLLSHFSTLGKKNILLHEVFVMLCEKYVKV